MLNITFIGRIYDTDGNLCDAAYQLYFPRDNIWSNVRKSFNGQYNINLGDSDILGQNGNASSTDKVVLVFWVPDTSARTDSNLTKWVALETHPTNIANVQDVTLYPSQQPNLSFTALTNGLDVTLQISADDEHSFPNNQLHTKSYFPINDIQSITVDWGDGTTDNNTTHTYSTPNTYTITVTATNNSGTQTQLSKDVYVSNDLQFNITYDFPSDPRQKITFNPTSNLPINSLQVYLDDDLIHTSTSLDPFSYFISNREKTYNLKAVVTYDDGVDPNKQVEFNFVLEIPPIPDFVQEKFGCGNVYKSTTTNGSYPIQSYIWEVIDTNENKRVFYQNSADHYFVYSWPYTSTFEVKLTIQDQNNNSYSTKKEYIINACPNQIVNIGDGKASTGFNVPPITTKKPIVINVEPEEENIQETKVIIIREDKRNKPIVIAEVSE